MRIEQLSLSKVGPFDKLKLTFPEGTNPKKGDIYIFTGPNGCGKSTLLYAIAGLLGGIHPQLGDLAVLQRMWGAESYVYGGVGEEEVWLGIPANIVKSSLIYYLWQQPPMHLFQTTEQESNYKKYWQKINENLSGLSAISEGFDLAAFAYAGYRSVDSYKLTAIQEVSASPLIEILSFTKKTLSQQLIQTIANLKAKEAFAKQESDDNAAKRFSSVISEIEKALEKVIEKPIKFVMTYDPLNVAIKLDNSIITLDLLPDGLKSIVSWLADLLMRLDRLKWATSEPLTQRQFILLLDEIEVHLHPEWQRKVVPMMQDLFPNAQIFVSSHSPFVVGSAGDATIFNLALDSNGKAYLKNTFPSQTGSSYMTILRSIFGIRQTFSIETENKLASFDENKHAVLKGEKDFDRDLVTLAEEIMKDKPINESPEVQQLIGMELKRVKRALEAVK